MTMPLVTVRPELVLSKWLEQKGYGRNRMAGQRSNQLNYVPTRQINEMRNRQCLCGFARFAYVAQIAQDDLNCSYFGLNRPINRP